MTDEPVHGAHADVDRPERTRQVARIGNNLAPRFQMSSSSLISPRPASPQLTPTVSHHRTLSARRAASLVDSAMKKTRCRRARRSRQYSAAK